MQRPVALARRPPPRGFSVELRWALRALCVTEIVSWGVLYYAFPVLVPDIRSDIGWSTTTLTAIFSGALVASALSGIAVGRIIHRAGPRGVMTAGSVLAVAAVGIVASAHDLWLFGLGWLMAGVAMSCVLYAPAFAAVTVWFGPARLYALTAITLVAGLASTVFAPVTAALSEHVSWRTTYLILGAVLGAVTIPLHAFLLRPPWRQAGESSVGPPPISDDVPPAAAAPIDAMVRVARPRFWTLAGAYTAMSLCSYAVVVNLVPLLHDRGYSRGEAAWALGLGGLGQVLGRLGYARLASRTSLAARSVGVFAVVALTTGVFALVSGPYWLIVLISVLAGNARGLSTLLSATAISDRWGTSRYSVLNGMFTAPVMAAGAVAPFAGAGLAAGLGGYPTAFVVLALVGVLAAAAVART